MPTSSDPIVNLMIQAGWLGMLLGVVSGAVIGLFFHREDWMGGYQSCRRRLSRLRHIFHRDNLSLLQGLKFFTQFCNFVIFLFFQLQNINCCLIPDFFNCRSFFA